MKAGSAWVRGGSEGAAEGAGGAGASSGRSCCALPRLLHIHSSSGGHAPTPRAPSSLPPQGPRGDGP